MPAHTHTHSHTHTHTAPSHSHSHPHLSHSHSHTLTTLLKVVRGERSVVAAVAAAAGCPPTHSRAHSNSLGSQELSVDDRMLVHLLSAREANEVPPPSFQMNWIHRTGFC